MGDIAASSANLHSGAVCVFTFTASGLVPYRAKFNFPVVFGGLVRAGMDSW